MTNQAEYTQLTWAAQPNDKHTWAFVYYCRRQGDKVQPIMRNGKFYIKVWRKNQ